MRVAFYTPYKSPTHRKPSGDRTVARNLIKALEQNGHHVRVMSEFQAELFWVQWKRWKQLASSLFATYRVAKTYRPEAWLTFVSDRRKPDLLGPLFSSWLGIPYVIYQAPFRGDYKRIRRKEGGGKHLWALPGYLLNLLALYSADHVIVDKSSDYMAYLRHSRIGPKLLFLQFAVSVQEFFPDFEERQQIRRALKIPEGIRVILSVSRLAGKLPRSPEERYGTPKALSVRFLIDCVSDLLKKGHGVKLLIVGDGESRGELEAYAKRLGGAVSFIGAIEHAQVLRSYYNAADIFAFPGFREPHAVVWLEAQACGLPVVAFSNEVVRHQETGLLVAPLDREGFVQSLEKLVQDETLRKTLGRAAAEYVKNCHDIQQWGQRLSGCLERPR